MIIQHFTDNDLYKFTTMQAIQKLYPYAKVKYKFINRANTSFPDGFANALKKEINAIASLSITKEEIEFINEKCYYFDPVFLELLKGYSYNPDEVTVYQKRGGLELTIQGFWYRTVLWEVPLMALISELYFKMTNQNAHEVESKAEYKALELARMNANFSDFGTRRRFSFDVHDRVVKTLKENSKGNMVGTSNVYFAMKNNLTPIGTHPHEWFMYHGAQYGYRRANHESLKAWAQIYKGALGIALTDTFTTDNFFECFDVQYAKLFDGLRWDSGDPIAFTDKALCFYTKNNIDCTSKTIVYSDSLDLEKVAKIKSFVHNKINDAYGIGTYFTNDVGVKPLNIVIKLTEASIRGEEDFIPTVKLSDVKGKNTGIETEVNLCKQMLKIQS
jgi:nicotinate phosphoribosyltransferase